MWTWQGIVIGKYQFGGDNGREPGCMIDFAFELGQPAVGLMVPKQFYDQLPPKSVDGGKYPQTRVALTVVPVAKQTASQRGNGDRARISTHAGLKCVAGALEGADDVGRRRAA